MIGALKGMLFTTTRNPTIILVDNVGYRVSVTDKFLHEHATHNEVFLYIHPFIREDTFDLYGFETTEELSLFESLLTVSGIGPKTALLVLNHGVQAIESAIREANVDFFTSIPRLGKKNAQKIIIELKNKIGSMTELNLSDTLSAEKKDLLDALISMGFSRKDSIDAIGKVPSSLTKTEDKLRFVIKNLGKHP